MWNLLPAAGFFVTLLTVNWPGASFGDITAANDVPAVQYASAFDDDALPNWAVWASGETLRRKNPPQVQDGKLYLLPSWSNSHSSIALSAQSDQLHKEIDITLELEMNTGTEGMGLAWIDTTQHSTKGPLEGERDWESPDLAGSLGVGFDASNPVNRDPFRGSGNVYDRPQHEVSLHFDGHELVKRVTDIDFRDEEPHAASVAVRFVDGGGEVSVKIDESSVFDHYFIPGMLPYNGRLALGARNSDIAGDVLVDNVQLVCRQPTETARKPLQIVAIDHQPNDKDDTKNEALVKFPESTDAYSRVICTLELAEPDDGFDEWDRTAHLFLFDDNDQRFELLRYVTPYDRGHTWHVDVTDFLPLLSGEKKIQQLCTTYGTGWVVTVTFDFYQGRAQRVPLAVINLWSGNPEIGNPDKPATDFYRPQTIPVPAEATAGKVRMVVTGHGMSPNSENAAEFMPLGRTLTVNGKSFTNRLWKTDNYLNPCRPQGGTWKYDRAGWAPGDVVRPWEVDVSALMGSSDELQIEYRLDEYINENRGQTWAPSHLTEAQLILYRSP